jgi:S1-C subfamily serine protease
VPALHVYTGMNPDYHTPGDTLDKINVAGAVRVVGFVDSVLTRLWTDPKPPACVTPAGGPRAGGAYLGVRPDPGSAFGTDGCELMQVLPDTPAAKAGLRAGDVVVGWNDKRIPNSEALLLAVQAGKPGERVRLKVRREEKPVRLDVKLGQR